jgi:hypothetical protein
MGHVEINMEGQDNNTIVLIMSLLQGCFTQVPLHVNLITLRNAPCLIEPAVCVRLYVSSIAAH